MIEKPNIIKEKIVNVDPAKDHLNRAPDQYFNSINNCTENEYKRTLEKLRPIKDFMPNPSSIVSVGVGGGLEVRVLAELFKDNDSLIVGVDLCDNALRIASKYLRDNNVQASLVKASAVYLPLHNVDGIVLSAIMHEIYSYVQDGKYAWMKALKSAVSSLSDGGVILLRDFAAPEEKGNVKLSFLTEDSKKFYKYFVSNFRFFSNWQQNDVKNFNDKRTDSNDYPNLDDNADLVEIPFGLAAEMMLHFKTYQADIENNCTTPYNKDWKEIDERYLPFNPRGNCETMTIDEYINEIIFCCDEELKCVKRDLSQRPDVARYFMKHFGIKKGAMDALHLFEQVPAKMELVFKKVK